ncbi:MAG: polysaccharide deacetylase family protein [Ferruginibacter sp.]
MKEVIIFSEQISPRLQYVCTVLLTQLLQTEVLFTENEIQFIEAGGVKINYSRRSISTHSFQIIPQGLLFETGIKDQHPECFNWNDFPAFFRTNGADIPFDILSASFYLISRYEEYLPHTKDMYGRYAHENSIAFQQDFLHVPLVNIWVSFWKDMLIQKFPSYQPQLPVFSYLNSFDIDIAWSYKHKGILRNLGGFIKRPSIERIKVLLGLQSDPFDVYAALNQLHQQYLQQPVYFFLVGKSNGKYDKQVLPSKNAMQDLIRAHAKKYVVGLHPSWKSGDDTALLLEEKQVLEKIIGKSISASRQHYIRFNLPDDFERLCDSGITDEYSMGYGSINGFRASIASSYAWYNLNTETITNLQLHPFCFMEANAIFEQKLSVQEAAVELQHYETVCRKYNGKLITVWHNNFISSKGGFDGWLKVYESLLNRLALTV